MQHEESGGMRGANGVDHNSSSPERLPAGAVRPSESVPGRSNGVKEETSGPENEANHRDVPVGDANDGSVLDGHPGMSPNYHLMAGQRLNAMTHRLPGNWPPVMRSLPTSYDHMGAMSPYGPASGMLSHAHPMAGPYGGGMMVPEKALPEPVRKYCVGCGEIVDFASGRGRMCRQRLCGRMVCHSCYDHAMEKGISLYHVESCLCAVCEFQNKKRPGGSISYWHSTFHDQEDLEFVRTLRDGLPQVNGLFLEVYGQRQACWRRRIGGIRKHYSFKQHGGYFESRLCSIFQQRDSSGGGGGGLLPGHHPTTPHGSALGPYLGHPAGPTFGMSHSMYQVPGTVHGASPTHLPSTPGSPEKSDVPEEPVTCGSVNSLSPAGLPSSVDLTDVLTGVTEEPRCAMCCHYMSDRQQYGIFACQAEHCGRIFCGQCVGEGRGCGIAMFHTNTQMCIICTFQHKMTRLGKKPYLPHTWHFDFFSDRELDVDFLRHLTKALPKVEGVWLDLENLHWRTPHQVFLFAAHGGFLEARWAAIQDAALHVAANRSPDGEITTTAATTGTTSQEAESPSR